jgi:hypothetical protein
MIPQIELEFDKDQKKINFTCESFILDEEVKQFT